MTCLMFGDIKSFHKFEAFLFSKFVKVTTSCFKITIFMYFCIGVQYPNFIGILLSLFLLSYN